MKMKPRFVILRADRPHTIIAVEEPLDVYDYIQCAMKRDHDEAANAESWAELAAFGEMFKGDNYIIRLTDRY